MYTLQTTFIHKIKLVCYPAKNYPFIHCHQCQLRIAVLGKLNECIKVAASLQTSHHHNNPAFPLHILIYNCSHCKHAHDKTAIEKCY